MCVSLKETFTMESCISFTGVRVCVYVGGGGRAGERTTSFVEGVYLINLSCPGVVSCYFRQETYNLTIHGITFSTRSSVLMIMHYYSCNRTQYVIG